MSRTKRIVCYAINGSGLGHLTRLTAVARWLRRYVTLLDNRTPEVIFLTSSDASDALANAGFAAFKIPSKTVAKKAELNKLEYRRLAKHFVWNTLGVFSPDLLVVDTFPSGSFDELFQVLDGPFKKGFIYRDVKPEYAARPTFRSALSMYDAIVAPHARHPATHGNVTSPSDIQFCGEVIQFEREDLLPAQEARKQLGIAAEHRVVYISAGGAAIQTPKRRSNRWSLHCKMSPTFTYSWEPVHFIAANDYRVRDSRGSTPLQFGNTFPR